jgi:DNA-binding CsgD family transcriptional regulator
MSQYRVVYEPINDYLTPHETETLASTAEGHTRDETAKLRHRAKATINGQLHSAISKLDADNAISAIAIAVIKGILRYEQVLCLCLVVTLGGSCLVPSPVYAKDLLKSEPTDSEQPFARYRVRAPRVRVRSGRRRED